ncbi:MAG: hypothetical protein IMF11_13620 [Proteobacteria bacterium]|nr:hypothetical protein [Pseudomonadota bacterium]
MQGLDLFAGFGYAEAEFDDWTATEIVGYNSGWTPIMGIYDYEDKDLPNAPEYTYNLGVQHCRELGFWDGWISLEQAVFITILKMK